MTRTAKLASAFSLALLMGSATAVCAAGIQTGGVATPSVPGTAATVDKSGANGSPGAQDSGAVNSQFVPPGAGSTSSADIAEKSGAGHPVNPSITIGEDNAAVNGTNTPAEAQANEQADSNALNESAAAQADTDNAPSARVAATTKSKNTSNRILGRKQRADEMAKTRELNLAQLHNGA